MSGVVSAVYRPPRRPGRGYGDWQRVELIADHAPSGQLVLREIGPFWPGVWLASRDQVRLAGPEFIPGGRHG